MTASTGPGRVDGTLRSFARQAALYGVAILAVAAATVLRDWAGTWLGHEEAFTLYFAAIAISAWTGGVGPGTLALLLGYIAAHNLFMPVPGNPGYNLLANALGALAYLASGAVIVMGMGRLHLASQRAREDEQSLNFALDAAKMTSFDADLATGRIQRSQNAREFFGVADIRGDRDDVYDIVHPDDKLRQRQAIQRAIETGEPYFCQYRVVRPADQRVMWVEAHGDVVRDRSGKPLRVSGVALDVTERMHLEQDLAERTRAMALISQRKSEFMAMLGHELRSPLAPIKNAIALLSQERADASARETALVALKRQVSAIERLVEDLFDVSRVEQGKMWLEPRPMDASNLISRAIDNVVPHIEARRQRLDVRLSPQPLIINADELRMVQVLTNLLSNASKFTARGGMISISASEDKGRAVLSVRDNGAGISPENLHSIFEVFYQASVQPQQAGLGLGLSLCKAIVDLHSGTIAARSEGAGKGSEFVVTLPIVQRSQPPVSIASPQRSREQASRET